MEIPNYNELIENIGYQQAKKILDQQNISEEKLKESDDE